MVGLTLADSVSTCLIALPVGTYFWVEIGLNASWICQIDATATLKLCSDLPSAAVNWILWWCIWLRRFWSSVCLMVVWCWCGALPLKLRHGLSF